jgi:hypothetical protein
MKIIRFWLLLCLAALSLAVVCPDVFAQANNVLPVVSISTTFAETMEPSPNVRVRPGEFTLQRSGSTNQPLVVFVSFSGTATWGDDYEAPRYISIPAGVREATILVAPADDLLPEGDETVIATVLGSVAGTVQNYVVDPAHNQATVVIHDNDAEGLPIVSIRGSSDVLEFCPPNADCISLSYLLRRTGALELPLTVFVQVGGTATPEFDYQALPRTVTFEAGRDTASIQSAPLDDQLYEGNETVVVTLVSGLDYLVDPNLRSVTTIIHDNEQPVPPVVSLELVIREAGETLINQNAIFWAEFNVKRTGPTTHDLLVLLSALEGTAVFNIDYRLDPISSAGFVRIPAGASSIAVRLYPIDDLLVEGTETAVVKLVPPPPLAGILVPPYSIDDAHGSVTMEIRDNDLNHLPNVAIVQPLAGALPANVPVEIVVEARDPDGYIPQVRFFADGRKIGEVNVQFFVEPPPGQLQQFTFVWNDAPVGKHALTAQAVDNSGGVGTSAAVLIEIGSSEPLPVVTVFARDAWAVEPTSNTNLNTATFRIRRSGPTNLPLVVAYSLSGSADNGTDYESLDSPATIPAGRRSALVVVRPRPDTQSEGLETVILRLQQANAAGNYVIGRPSSAIALISDGPLPVGWPPGAVLPGGLIHICFTAEPEQNFRLEATTDLQTWETIGNALSSDGTWHFVDSETDQPRRFYRLTPEPVLEPE